MSRWVKLGHHVPSTSREYQTLISLARAHCKMGHNTRFRRINEKIYINLDYERECEKERLHLEDLWFKVREFFKDDFSLAKYFAPIVDKKAPAVNRYFNNFKFGGNRPDGWLLRRKYISVFEEFLKDKG